MSDTAPDLTARIRRLEDRHQISECVIRYAMALDRADWALFQECISDPIHIDFEEWSGMKARDWGRAEWAGFASKVLDGFDGRQHLSPNHAVTFTGEDEAICTSYMYAQHHLAGAPGGDDFLMRGSYTNVLERAGDGWTIKSMTQHFNWGEGNADIFKASEERGKALRGAAHA